MKSNVEIANTVRKPSKIERRVGKTILSLAAGNFFNFNEVFLVLYLK